MEAEKYVDDKEAGFAQCPLRNEQIALFVLKEIYEVIKRGR